MKWATIHTAPIRGIWISYNTDRTTVLWLLLSLSDLLIPIFCAIRRALHSLVQVGFLSLLFSLPIPQKLCLLTIIMYVHCYALFLLSPSSSLQLFLHTDGNGLLLFFSNLQHNRPFWKGITIIRYIRCTLSECVTINALQTYIQWL